MCSDSLPPIDYVAARAPTPRVPACATLFLALFLASALPASAQTEYKLFTLNAEATVNGAKFQQASTYFSSNPAAGTGNFKPFLRLQKNTTEAGHNTGGTLQNDEKSGPWTTNLRYREIPVVGGNLEFFLDINEINNQQYLSLEELKLYVSPTPNLSANAGTLASLGTKLYDLDAAPAGDSRVVLNYALDGSGSGRSDLRVLIPRAPFATACANINPCYVYLWSKFGAVLLDGTNAESDDGFEEWNLFERDFLGVNKTAVPAFTRTISWDIDKSVDVAQHDLFNGQSASSTYTVDVTKNVVDGSYAVSGVITVTNPSTSSAAFTLTAVSDVILASGGDPQVPANVVCVGLPVSIAPGGTYNCSYSASVPNGSDRTNRVTISFASGADVFEASREVAFSFGGVTPTVVGFPLVNVTDSWQGDLGTLGESGSFSYSREFSCGSTTTYPNTATITETGQSDDASVQVNCYGLTVAKACETAFTRRYDWSLAKTATNVNGPLTLAQGEVFTVTYEVGVTRDAGTDTDAKVSCVITVTNNNPSAAATNVAVADALAGATNESLSCNGTIAWIAGNGGTGTCTYAADLPDKTTRTNSATATLYGVKYTGTGNVTFGTTPTSEVDACANVADAALGFGPKEVCTNTTFTQNDGLLKQLNTSTCGEGFSFANVAKLVEADSGTEHESSVTVNWQIPCPLGCTLTQGYWKTHNFSFKEARKGNGPPADATWFDLGDVDGDLVSEGEKETFYLSGTTYFGVMQTPPAGGNVYYSLAHQFIAARLNLLAGADGAAVSAAMASATTFFQTTTPAQAGTLKGKAKSDLVALAGVLGSYNEGRIGPGHCDEDGVTTAPLLTTVNPALQNGPEQETSGSPESPSADETAALTVAAAATAARIPTAYALSPSYPNPVRDATTIAFDLPETADVSLRVIDLLGREVTSLVSTTMEAGSHRVRWDVNAVADGTYVILFRANGFSQSGRVVVSR